MISILPVAIYFFPTCLVEPQQDSLFLGIARATAGHATNELVLKRHPLAKALAFLFLPLLVIYFPHGFDSCINRATAAAILSIPFSIASIEVA